VTFDYAASAATATRLLTKFGAAATLKRQTAGAYNPATGATTVTVTSLTTTAAVFDFDAKHIDGTLILVGDKRAYLAPAYTPAQGDVLAWQGTDYQVVAVKAVSPAGTPVLFECQIRG
jgi:hypothetical protein